MQLASLRLVRGIRALSVTLAVVIVAGRAGELLDRAAKRAARCLWGVGE